MGLGGDWDALPSPCSPGYALCLCGCSNGLGPEGWVWWGLCSGGCRPREGGVWPLAPTCTDMAFSHPAQGRAWWVPRTEPGTRG